jgi:hypothetical protein
MIERLDLIRLYGNAAQLETTANRGGQTRSLSIRRQLPFEVRTFSIEERTFRGRTG